MYLFSNDLYLIKTWQQNLKSFSPKLIEDIENLSNIQNSLIICSVKSFENIDFSLKSLISNKNRILLLDSIPNFSQGQRFLKLGIRGYGNILMSKPFLESAIMSINDGLVWLHPELMQNLILNLSENKTYDDSLLENLTSREKEVTLLLKDGYSNSQVTKELNMSINTVKSHIKKIYEKLNINDRLSLALLFKR